MGKCDALLQAPTYSLDSGVQNMTQCQVQGSDYLLFGFMQRMRNAYEGQWQQASGLATRY